MDKQQLINLLLGELGAAEITADSPTPTTADNQKTGFIYFTDKEINKMPKNFKKVFRINGCRAHVRKRTGGKIKYKRIPVTPMLVPYLQSVTELNLPKPRVLNNRFKKILPTHKLYDLRTTFQTRCTECGVAEVAIGLFMGNGIGGKLKKAYTDVSDEWLIKEANKLKY